MELREAFLASKLFGNGGGGGGGGGLTPADWDAIATGGAFSGEFVASGSADHIVNHAFFAMPITGASFPNVTSVGSTAFQNCSNLSEVYMPNLKEVGSSAFQTCGLTSVDFPDLSIIGNAAFFMASHISYANLPNVSASIGTGVFQGASVLKSVSIPELTIIPQNTFSGTALLSVYAPKASLIGPYAFAGCKALSVASFPALTSISSNAFSRCSTLMSLFLLGASVVRLYHSAIFAGCPIRDISVAGVYGSVFVPASLVDTYKTTSVWSSYYSDRLVGLTDEQIAALPI